MKDVAAMLPQAVAGLAHALVFGIFLLAAAGKLAACKPGMRAMCVKGGADAGLALLAALFVVPGMGLAGAMAAIAVGAGGWLRERIRRNTVCNCFGVLTAVLHPWRNGFRALLCAGGTAALALSSSLQAASPGLWIGAAAGLALLLGGMALAFARRSLARQPVVVPIEPILALAPGTIGADTIVASDKDGRGLPLRELIVPGQPLALVLVAPGCKACSTLKPELDPVLGKLPFPAFYVIESAPADPLPPTALFDAGSAWRRRLGVKNLPSLVVIDDSASQLACPVAAGAEAILGQLLRLSAQAGGPESRAPMRDAVMRAAGGQAMAAALP